MDTNMSETQDAMETLKQAADTSFAKVGAGFEQGQAQLKGQMEKALKKAENVAAFSQGTVEAIMKSSQIWATGMQDLTKSIAATAQAQMEHTMSTVKSMAGLRSLKDLMDAQASFARAAMEKAMSESGRVTDASLRLTEDAMAPLTARMSLAVETFAKPV